MGAKRRVLASVVVSVAASVPAACGGGSRPAGRPSAGCAAPASERLDPASTIHLFPAAPEPHYLTDPPTSGPHRLGPPPAGVLTTPIVRSRQVAMLEAGYVIVQHAGLSPTQVTTLDSVAGDPLVTVAPAGGGLPSPIVATAWTWKLECGGALDPPAVSAIRAFIAAHRGVGFSDGPPRG